jgi:hypothetical protein
MRDITCAWSVAGAEVTVAGARFPVATHGAQFIQLGAVENVVLEDAYKRVDVG